MEVSENEGHAVLELNILWSQTDIPLKPTPAIYSVTLGKLFNPLYPVSSMENGKNKIVASYDIRN